MSRNPHDLVEAPLGLDASADPAWMSAHEPNVCQNLVNLLTDRRGKLRGNIGLSNVLPVFSNQIDGIGYLYPQSVTFSDGSTSTSPLAGRLLVVEGGTLHTYPIVSPYTNPPTFDTGAATSGTGLIPGHRTRFATFGQEAYAVQDANAYSNYRIQYDGTVTSMGMAMPILMAIASAGTNTGAKAGTRKYTATLVDSRGRESSPYSSLSAFPGVGVPSHTYAGGTPDYNLTVTPGNLQAVAINIYAQPDGSSTYYYLGTGATNGTTTVTVKDTLTDAQLTAQVPVAPYFGQNDAPLPASLIAVWKNRTVLNQTNDPNAIQISNFGSATQFSVTGQVLDSDSASSTFGQVLNTLDGQSMRVGTDQGDVIVALVPFGSLLFVFKRRSIWYLAGDDITDFVVRPVKKAEQAEELATPIAPDSVRSVGNGIAYLADTGVYLLTSETSVDKFSDPVESLLYIVRAQSGGYALMEGAVAWFAANVYKLAIGDTIYCFDFGSKGWRLEKV